MTLLNQDGARDLLERALALSPARQTELSLRHADEQLTRFASNEIIQNVARRTRMLTLRIQDGPREAAACVNRFDDASIKRAYARAAALLKAALADEDLLPILSEPQDYKVAPALAPAALNHDPAARARAIAGLTERADKEGLEAAGRFEVAAAEEAYMNNHGLFAYHPSSSSVFSTTVSASSAGAEGWALGSHEDPDKVGAAEVGGQAVELALKSRDPKKLAPGRYTVVLKPAAVGEILLFLSWLGFNGLSYVERRSYHAGRLGEKFFGDEVTIKDDPFDPRAPGRPWDLEGMATSPVTLIDRGVAAGLCLDRRSAQKMSGATKKACGSTGHALPQPNSSGASARNVVMEGDDSKELSDLIAETRSGLLVNKLHYCNVVNPMTLSITGMTRSGVFQIGDGELLGPVNNFRFTISLLDIFKAIDGMSRPRRAEGALFGSRFVAPALRIDGFQMTSATEF